MIYIGLRDWERALLFVEIVIASPAINTTSVIQVEAYKKWVLVSLLLKGHVSLPSPPKSNNITAYLIVSIIAYTSPENHQRSRAKTLCCPSQSV